MKQDQVTAIIVAAGQGKRMNTKVAKQYLPVHGKPVLYYTIRAFEESNVDQIILVVGTGEIEYVKKEIVDRFQFKKIIKIVEGGKERYHSVFHALEAVEGSEYVLIHDGARPFVTSAIIERVVAGVKEYKACVVGMPVKDTIKVVDSTQKVIETPAREHLWLVQTPQAFSYSLIKGAYDKLFENSTCSVTDDAMVVEMMTDYPIHMIEGDYRNIKITTEEDIKIAEVFL